MLLHKFKVDKFNSFIVKSLLGITMYGWNGKILRVNLSERKVKVQTFDLEFATTWLGGRGFAIKILWDEVPPGTDPLSPMNKLIIAAGPLTGLPGPSTGKLVVAAKSPLTDGYGDGNVGTLASVHLRKAGFDAIVVEGKAEKPTYLYIENDNVEFLDAEDLWGLTTFETEHKLRKIHGGNVGILEIGPAGEKLVRFAVITSQEGRAGGRPGIGAVMGSKNLKAIVVRGTGEVSLSDPKEYLDYAVKAYSEIKSKPLYSFWIRQGTMATIEWSQENSVLPTFNFREGVFEYYRLIDGYSMEAMKITQRGCPNCNMTCGNVVIDCERKDSELDYENVAMLGSNIGIGHLGKVAALNRIADEMGLDTISLGNVIGFAMEASEKKLIDERIEWGDFKEVRELIFDIAYRRGLGNLLAEGTRRASRKIKGGSERWAMNIKGLEISAYNCHTAPGMALAYGTSSIGAHHKEAWLIAWEVRTDRFAYSREKVEKLIEFQRIRGGFFESVVACRLPWIELGFDLDWYPKLLNAATGAILPWEELYIIADRIYTLIRAFWVREYNGIWDRHMDYPPSRWFEEPLSQGPFKGAKLDMKKYDEMLSIYYELRGWDERGVPTKTTLKRLGLEFVIPTLEKYTKLRE